MRKRSDLSDLAFYFGAAAVVVVIAGVIVMFVLLPGGERDFSAPMADLMKWLIIATIVAAAASMVMCIVVHFLNTWRKWRFFSRDRNSCPKCGYDLTGHVSGTCPECGRKLLCGEDRWPRR